MLENILIYLLTSKQLATGIPVSAILGELYLKSFNSHSDFMCMHVVFEYEVYLLKNVGRHKNNNTLIRFYMK